MTATVTHIKVEFIDGSNFEIEHSSIIGQSGTSYSGGSGGMASSAEAGHLEERINDAVNDLRLYPDLEREINWIGAMGAETVNVMARFDEEHERVTVDHATLVRMAKGVLDNVMVSEQNSRWDAATLLNIEPDIEGRFDITEAAGGFKALEGTVII